MAEEELFNTEKQRSRSENAETLVDAGGIESGSVRLESETDDWTVEVPEIHWSRSNSNGLPTR